MKITTNRSHVDRQTAINTCMNGCCFGVTWPIALPYHDVIELLVQGRWAVSGWLSQVKKDIICNKPLDSKLDLHPLWELSAQSQPEVERLYHIFSLHIPEYSHTSNKQIHRQRIPVPTWRGKVRMETWDWQKYHFKAWKTMQRNTQSVSCVFRSVGQESEYAEAQTAFAFLLQMRVN